MDSERTIDQVAEASNKSLGWLNPLVIFLVVLFVISGVIGLTGFYLWRGLFTPPVVTRTLTNEIISSDFASSLLRLFATWQAEQHMAMNESTKYKEPDMVQLVSNIKLDDWRRIRQLLMTDGFATRMVSTSVDGYFGWLDSKEDWPDITYNLTPIKERIDSQQGTDAIGVVYSAMPVCTDVDMADFKYRLSNTPRGEITIYNLCQFPTPWHDDQVKKYYDALGSVNEIIPRQINLSQDILAASSVSSASLTSIKNGLKILRSTVRWIWLVPIILLLFILGLKVRSRRSLGLFVGIPLAVCGLMVVLLARIGQAYATRNIALILPAGWSDILRQQVSANLAHLVSILVWPLPLVGLLLEIVGMVLVVLIFIRRSAPP